MCVCVREAQLTASPRINFLILSLEHSRLRDDGDERDFSEA